MPALRDHFHRFAVYNRLANQRLYDACAELSDAAYREIRPAYFRSIHGTLNHILVGDRLWLARFEGRPAEGLSLDAILYEDFGDLRRAREEEDRRLEAFMCALDDDRLMSDLCYVNSEGKTYRDPFVILLAHLFNHQTHHRGQVHDMLMQTEVPPPSLDMHRLLNP